MSRNAVSRSSRADRAPATQDSARRAGLAAVLLAAFLVRTTALVLFAAQLDRDPDGYRELGLNLARHGVYGYDREGSLLPTAYRPPLYPALLAAGELLGLGPRATVVGLHLILGMVTVWLTVVAARQLGLRRAALFAGMFVALDPILVYQSAQVMTETGAALLTVVGVLALARASDQLTPGRAATAGAVLAAAGLYRPTFYVVLVAAGILLALVAGRQARRGPAILAYVVAAVVVVAPWAIRNHIRIGRTIVATTHGGYTLHLANNRSFYVHLETAPRGSVWEVDQQALRDEWAEYALRRPGRPPSTPPPRWPDAETERDRAHYATAFSAIGARPATFAFSCLARCGRFWQLVPHDVTGRPQPGLRRLIGVWYGAVFALAAGGVWRVRGGLLAHPWIWCGLPVVALALVHTVYWTDMRMRGPVMPCLALFAAGGLALLLKSLFRRDLRD